MVAGASGRSLAAVGGAQLGAGLVGGAILWSVGRVIDALTGDVPDWSATWPWIVVLAVLTAVGALLTAVGREQQVYLSELVHRHTAVRVVDAAATVAFSRFDFGGFYDRMARAIQGAGASATAIVWGTLGATRSLIDAIFITIVLAAIAPIVIPIAAAAYIPLSISSRLGNRTFHRFLWDQTPGDRRRQYLAATFGERDPGREIRMFDLGVPFGAWHRELWDERLTALRSVVRTRLTQSAIGSLVASAISAVALGLVAWLASRGDLSLADAGVAILAVHRLSGTARQLNQHLASLDRGGRQMRDYDRFIAEAAAERELLTGPAAPDTIEQVDLVGVHFTYPEASAPALTGIDLSLRPGEVTAIVGPNGSGKSTLMMLLCGLYEPDNGEICWNGSDIASFHPQTYRDRIAAMFQEFTRYRLSTRVNVAVADFDDRNNDDRVTQALHAAGAEGLLDRLDQGLETELSPAWEDGTELSAGQWQRIAAARALFRQSPLVILDEPTADLDALAEQALIDELVETAGDRCVVFISHRFSAIRKADRIVVLDQGRIVEEGTHGELVGAAGVYATMYRTQTGFEQ